MTEMTDEEVFGRPKEMSDADVFGPPAGGIGNVSEALPEAFIGRLRQGEAIGRILQAAGKEAASVPEGTPTGFENDTLNLLIEKGVFHDPLKSRPGPLQMANEAVMLPAAQAWQAIMRGTAMGIHGAGGLFGQLMDEIGVSNEPGTFFRGGGEQAKREIINAGNWAMIEAGMGRFARPHVEGGKPMDRTVGTLPTEADFVNGAKVLVPVPERISSAAVKAGDDIFTGTHHGEAFEKARAAGKSEEEIRLMDGFVTSTGRYVDRAEASKIAAAAEQFKSREQYLRETGELSKHFEGPYDAAVRGEGHLYAQHIIADANLRRMWKEDGIHPAEAVHDAANDAFLKNEITAARKDVKLEPDVEEFLTETGGRPGSLSAAATEPPDIPLDVQPAQPPGSLMGAVRAAGDQLFDMGRDAQMLVAPMARGTTDSMAMAKDFANAMRRNRWDWDRIHTDITKRFTPEQMTRMWNAMDEESLSLRLGEPESARAHQGLNTLTPEERAVVTDLDARQQLAWMRAVDLGMVEGEGIPMHAPRMVVNIANASEKEGTLALDVIGRNLRTRTPYLKQRKYMEVEETEAAAKAKYGPQAEVLRDIRTVALSTAQLEDAAAGRTLINNIKAYGERTGNETVAEGAIPSGSETKWFTLDHPSFKTWRPKFEVKDGKVEVLKDSEGNVVFEQVPLYVHGDFEGPLRAVLDHRSGAIYGGMMALKGKTMSLIMNSPMIHNAVEWGRAVFAMPGKVATFKVYFEGNRAKNNVPLMHEAIDNGLVPIGHRFFNQDISGIAEQPSLTPGRSWTAQVLGAVPGLFDEAAGVAVKRAIDKAGDFWHNTLLWDRVADLQMGLYVNFRSSMIEKGFDAPTASKMAAHWANRYAGALPKEAMSDAATKISNMLLFSRSFTLGNMGVLKDMLTGLPKDVLAQIERDAGFRAGSVEAGIEAGQAAKSTAASIARRKAISVVALDVAGMYAFNSIFQNATNVLFNDSTIDKEFHGYVTRIKQALTERAEHPLKLLQPFDFLEHTAATSENEPSKQERIKVGYSKDGTAIYARAPIGKIGEEFIGYMTGPLDMMRKKQGTLARPAFQIMANDAGFGRKIYDPTADTPAKYLNNAYLIAKHMALSQTPEGQIRAGIDLVKGDGDAKVNALQALGPVAGLTFSKGAPGGPAMGEVYRAREQFEFRLNQALPDIRKQILRGDTDGAIGKMTEIDVPQSFQRWIIKTTLNPSTRLSSQAMQKFYLQSTPEQRDRFERAMKGQPAP